MNNSDSSGPTMPATPTGVRALSGEQPAEGDAASAVPCAVSEMPSVAREGEGARAVKMPSNMAEASLTAAMPDDLDEWVLRWDALYDWDRENHRQKWVALRLGLPVHFACRWEVTTDLDAKARTRREECHVELRRGPLVARVVGSDWFSDGKKPEIRRRQEFEESTIDDAVQSFTNQIDALISKK